MATWHKWHKYFPLYNTRFIIPCRFFLPTTKKNYETGCSENISLLFNLGLGLGLHQMNGILSFWCITAQEKTNFVSCFVTSLRKGVDKKNILVADMSANGEGEGGGNPLSATHKKFRLRNQPI